MGYSSSAKASMVLDALMNIVRDTASSNVWRDHFYEIGRENSDGSITGKVIRFTSPDMGDGRRMGVKAGTFRIDSDGKIVRFPATTKGERKAAYIAGMRKYAETFMPAIRNIKPEEIRYTFTVE